MGDNTHANTFFLGGKYDGTESGQKPRKKICTLHRRQGLLHSPRPLRGGDRASLRGHCWQIRRLWDDEQCTQRSAGGSYRRPVVPVPETPQPTPELSPEPEIPAEEAAETAAQDVYLWPVDGTVTRAYAMTALAYDETMADWRTHDGIDIAADYGAVVSAMASGTVTQVYHDDRYGMTVVTERADGLRCTYANLEAIPTVNVGDSVSAGDTIGSVGDSAGCESAQESHLHLSVSVSGQSVSPLDYLPQKN